MTTRPSAAAVPGLAPRLVVAAIGVIVLLVAACSAVEPSNPPSPSSGATPGPAASGAAAGSAAVASPSTGSGAGAGAGAGSTRTGQTDTAWGRIWDAVPAAFPHYPGSTAADAAASGPASAVLAVAHPASDVAGWFRAAMAVGGYAVDGATEPLEDGGFDLEASRAGGCRVGVRLTPTGSLTMVTVLYGVACPDPASGS